MASPAEVGGGEEAEEGAEGLVALQAARQRAAAGTSAPAPTADSDFDDPDNLPPPRRRASRPPEAPPTLPTAGGRARSSRL